MLMPKIIVDILASRLGLAGVVFLVMLAFYEGVPLVGHAPFVGTFLEAHLGGRVGHVAAEARRDAEARMTANFFTAMGGLTDAAEKARAARRFCLDTGRVYDFATGRCRQG
ncbi:MAG: hypothetical protein Kow0026_25980 [Oricola sp.]